MDVLWLYFSQARARGLDVSIEIKKQIRMPHWKNSSHPHNVLKIGLEGCHLGFGKLCFHFIFNDPGGVDTIYACGFAKILDRAWAQN